MWFELYCVAWYGDIVDSKLTSVDRSFDILEHHPLKQLCSFLADFKLDYKQDFSH